jgi:hypothetical protein
MIKLILVEFGEVDVERLKNILPHILDLVFAELPSSAPPVDKGGIQEDDPLPRFTVLREGLLEEADGGGR